jgi:hypothetical protein
MKVWTSEQRWGDIAHSAVILGIVPDFSKASMLALNSMLEARRNLGLVQKRKEGTAQSSPAWYKAEYEDGGTAAEKVA